jgi:hypothetical protein
MAKMPKYKVVDIIARRRQRAIILSSSILKKLVEIGPCLIAAV